MAFFADLNSVTISDPDGQRVKLGVSFRDDTINVDPLLQVVASATFLFDPFTNSAGERNKIRDTVIAYGQQVRAARASATAFASAFPPGSTTITIP